jgi:hypothetical protein
MEQLEAVDSVFKDAHSSLSSMANTPPPYPTNPTYAEAAAQQSLPPPPPPQNEDTMIAETQKFLIFEMEQMVRHFNYTNQWSRICEINLPMLAKYCSNHSDH